MRKRLTKFVMTAAIGYGVVVVLLAGGMMLMASRFDSVATAHVDRIRTEENQITYAERLRWAGEAIVAAGRGYLISADPEFLTALDAAEANFDHAISSLTHDGSNGMTKLLVTNVAKRGQAFRDRQEVLVASMKTSAAATVTHRFEAELVPRKRDLTAALDNLIDYKETAIDGVYRRVAHERAVLRTSLHAVLAVLVLASFAIAAFVASALGRSYKQEQRAVEMARKATAARDEIMGVVAHDLRNPLTSIVMRASVLRETAESPMTKKHADAIETVVRRMDGLIKSMLDVATIEAGHFTVSPEPYEVDALLDATMEMFGGLAEKQQIHFERRPAVVNSLVRADRDRVLQVLQNLVGNAMKFTPEGGHVLVEATREAAVVTFRVVDTGPGIPNENVKSVFDRFWKRDVAGTKGTGLGLFIAKGIVEAHGGRIWAESKVGAGAAFCFTLPAVQRDVAISTHAPRESSESERNLHLEQA